MSYNGKDPRFESVIVTDVLATTPASPKSGSHKIVDRNGQLFLMDSSGVENPVGGGAGEKNYILSPSSAVSWVASSAAITVATDTTVGELPRALTTKTGIKITGVSGSTAYVYFRFTLDAADYNRKLKVKLDMRPVSGYVASDMKLDMYSNTASNYGGTSTRIVTSSDSSALCVLPNMTGQFETTVDMPGSTAPYMELRVGLNAASTQALVISDVVVGPGLQPQGAVVEEWQSFTPTGDYLNCTYTGMYRRVGTNIESYVHMALTGAAPVGTGLNVQTIPTGLTFDTTALGSFVGYLGSVRFVDTGTAEFFGQATYSTSNEIRLRYGLDATGVTDANTTASLPYVFANTDTIEIFTNAPIAEWAGSGTVNVSKNDVEYAYNTTITDASDSAAFGYGPAGALFALFTAERTKRVRFQKPIQSTDTIMLELTLDGGASWIPAHESRQVQPRAIANAARYGVAIEGVNSTDVDVYFESYASANGAATYGAAGEAWTSLNSNSSALWRVKKFSGGAAVGFSKATDGSLGLLNTYVDTTASTFTFDGSGGTSSSVTMAYQRLGDWVTVYIPVISGTSGTSSTGFVSDTALETWARPATLSQFGSVPNIENNSTSTGVAGYVGIATSGLITISKDSAGGLFTNGVTCGSASGFAFSYFVGTGS